VLYNSLLDSNMGRKSLCWFCIPENKLFTLGRIIGRNFMIHLFNGARLVIFSASVFNFSFFPISICRE
jgi:hypothetical protein